MTAAIELSGVTKRYGGRTALSKVDLSVPEGSALGLLGPNGAGKTTALRLILGIVHATDGSVQLQGWDPLDAEARRNVGYLPERLMLPGHMTLHRFLEVHGGLAGLSGSALEAEIEAVAEQTGIAARLDDRLGELSKGLTQRAGFAQAFMGEPKVLLLDEPTTGLDPIGMREARGWIEAARDRGAAVLVSSHLLSEVERLCDRIAVLNQSHVVAEGSLEEILREGEELEDAFIRLVKGEGAARAS